MQTVAVQFLDPNVVPYPGSEKNLLNWMDFENYL